jgi:hypothetical protein
MSDVSRRELLLLGGAALVGAAATDLKANAIISLAKPETVEVDRQEEASLAPSRLSAEPIIIRPGVYTTPGGPEIMGLCIMIDNQDAQWEVTTTAQYGTVIRIKNGSKWNAQEYIDPNTGKRKLQVFREGAKLNALELKQFIHPTEDVYTPNGNAADNEESQAKIHFTI